MKKFNGCPLLITFISFLLSLYAVVQIQKKCLVCVALLITQIFLVCYHSNFYSCNSFLPFLLTKTGQMSSSKMSLISPFSRSQPFLYQDPVYSTILLISLIDMLTICNIINCVNQVIIFPIKMLLLMFLDLFNAPCFILCCWV